MRKIITTCVGAAALFMTMAFAPPLVQAMTIAAPAGVGTAAQATKLAQDVVYVCRGLLWRRCWWVPATALWSSFQRRPPSCRPAHLGIILDRPGARADPTDERGGCCGYRSPIDLLDHIDIQCRV
jgi:hypothetical protein